MQHSRPGPVSLLLFCYVNIRECQTTLSFVFFFFSNSFMCSRKNRYTHPHFDVRVLTNISHFTRLNKIILAGPFAPTEKKTLHLSVLPILLLAIYPQCIFLWDMASSHLSLRASATRRGGAQLFCSKRILVPLSWVLVWGGTGLVLVVRQERALLSDAYP